MLEQVHAIGADLRGQGVAGRFFGRETIVFEAITIAVKPDGWYRGLKPAWVCRGEDVEGMAQCLADAFESVEHLDSSEYMGRVGALATFALDQALGAKEREHGLKQQQFRITDDQALAKLAQDGGIEARIGQLQRQGIFPINASAYGGGGLLIGESFCKLHDGHERKLSGRFSGLPLLGEEMREVGV